MKPWIVVAGIVGVAATVWLAPAGVNRAIHLGPMGDELVTFVVHFNEGEWPMVTAFDAEEVLPGTRFDAISKRVGDTYHLSVWVNPGEDREAMARKLETLEGVSRAEPTTAGS